jgi:hypothetical protein
LFFAFPSKVRYKQKVKDGGWQYWQMKREFIRVWNDLFGKNSTEEDRRAVRLTNAIAERIAARREVVPVPQLPDEL